MPSSTRSSAVEDSTTEFVNNVVSASFNEFRQSIQDITKNISDLTETINGSLLQQQYLTNELQKVKNGEVNN